MATGFSESRRAMIKHIIPPSAFKAQSAMAEILLVTHGQTMKNTLRPIGGAVKTEGWSGWKKNNNLVHADSTKTLTKI